MITVYHNPDPTFRVTAEAMAAFREGKFKKVAEVVSDTFPEGVPAEQLLEEAFALTNSALSPWETNPAAGAIGTGHRSTSVGDVIVSQHGAFMVAGVGFTPLP